MSSSLESLFGQIPGDGGGPPPPPKKLFEPFEDEEEYPPNGKFEFLNIKLENIDDLIELGLEFKEGLYNPHTRYNLNLFKVARW